MADYVRNLWYMAAWADEVPDDGFLARTLLDRKWLLMQLADGGWTMLADRCPHRFVALSKGERVGDTIRCGYHGLGFDRSGYCVFNPFGGDPPAGARVPTVPVAERHAALWFWPGDPRLVDPSTIPDFAFVTGPQHVRDHLTIEGNYEYVTDNLMDLSHAEFIHRESFGVNGSLLTRGIQSVVQDDDGAIWNNWDITGATPPDWAKPLVPEGTHIDQWLHMRWHAPASMALGIGLARAGTEGREMVVPAMRNPHIITPETATASHYFYTREPGEKSASQARQVFQQEDEPMIASAQEGFGGVDFWDARPVILPSDAGAIRARRRLMRLRRSQAI